MRSKLDAVRRLFVAREQGLAGEYRHARAEREHREAQSRELGGLLDHYRGMHAGERTSSAARLARFQRFYQQVADTLDTHTGTVRRLVEQEQISQSRWHDAWRSRHGLERLLENRALLRRRQSERRERRRAVKTRASSMLNSESDQPSGD